mmetsp:Transcript_22389/g.55167  ORF Transcript_22389/g.55167 Transcript_22389/m.55167 type:complete len:258 (-) Transcript_22389:591-1364(-)
MKLEAVRAVVTGAGGGLGRAFCQHLCESGAKVFGTDLDAKGLAQTQLELSAPHKAGMLHLHQANVTSESEVKALFEKARESMGGCNVLVNNAGILRDSMLIKKDKETGLGRVNMPLSDWNAVLAVNLTAPFLCAREFAAGCVGREKEAVIVNMSSAARNGSISQSNYSAAKAGLAADTRVWARELAKFNIRVGAIAPGAVETQMLSVLSDEATARLKQMTPLGRLGHPEDIWIGVKFIVECDFFTGKVVDIDGGMQL